ncbi:MAG: type VI secretion system tip protein VgrG [Deltaproteobacteria bacterium]|nr:type VI secretion system tip protein VgrG [Deltaproteobacteria bacterium]
MPPNHVFSASQSWIARVFGTGPLPAPRFDLEVRSSPGGKALHDVKWRVGSVVLDEALHSPYVLEVEASASPADIELDELVGSRLRLEVARGESVRVIHGVVQQTQLVGTHEAGERVSTDGDGTRAERVSVDEQRSGALHFDHNDSVRVRLQAGPALAMLAHSRRSRVFQGLTVVEVAQAVTEPLLSHYGSTLVTDRLAAGHPPRDYCVQYRETDLDFVLRILAEAGITMLFDHSGETEVPVLVDGNRAFPAAGVEPVETSDVVAPAVPFVQDRADEVPIESFSAVAQSRQAGPQRWEAATRDWQSRPPAVHRITRGDAEAWGGVIEVDQGRADERTEGKGPIADISGHQAALMQARDQAAVVTLSATSNATVLRAGSVFELAGPPDDGYGQRWVVTRIRHRGEVPGASIHGSAEEAGPQYANEVECQRYEARVVPTPRARPIAQGIHTATVMGPKPKTIHTDRFGRVQVQMAWDDRPADVQPRSCWLRVMQPWAGDGFGTVFIPRVGMEVVVSFVDGDPDRPLCIGCVYDGANTPPYPLPESETRTVLRTSSTDGSGGFNELSFEDAAGDEEVYLHTQGSLREVVRSEHTATIGGSRRESIGRARLTTIGSDDVVQVGGDRIETIAGNVAGRVRGSVRLRVSDAPADPAGMVGYEMMVEHGRYTIDAAEAIVLQCGASRLELHPRKIVLNGPEIIAQCPNAGATHETSLAMTTTSIELVADAVRQRAAVVAAEAERQIILGSGPGGQASSILLSSDSAQVRAREVVELRASTVVAAGTEAATLKGSTCSVEGAVVAVSGERIGVDGTGRVEISTPGQVNIRGHERITLN